MIKDFIIRVCHIKNPTFAFVLQSSFTKVKKLEDYCSQNGIPCHFSVPVVAGKLANLHRSIPFNRLFSINGVAFITLKDDKWKNTASNFIHSAFNTWPLFLLSMLAAILSGMIVWILVSSTIFLPLFIYIHNIRNSTGIILFSPTTLA